MNKDTTSLQGKPWYDPNKARPKWEVALGYSLPEPQGNAN